MNNYEQLIPQSPGAIAVDGGGEPKEDKASVCFQARGATEATVELV